MRSSTFRALTGAALTAGLLGTSAGAALAGDTHEVAPGETLADIAGRHDGISWRDLLEANSDAISDADLIFPGQRLALSGRGDAAEETHEVQPGETLSVIAGAYDHVASWRALADANSDVIDDPDVVLPGQVLGLTDATTPAEPATPAEPEAATETATESDPQPAHEHATATAGVWDRLAECESNGNWSSDTGNGFYGGLQFTLDSWQSVGGTGYPHEASREEQIRRGEQLQAIQGWDAWPACSEKLGLR